MSKTLEPLSFGLQNILNNPTISKHENTIRAGSFSIKFNPYIGDYYSQFIARHHLNDPTIITFDFSDCTKLFTQDLLKIFEKILNCKSVTLDENSGYLLRLISIKLDCRELYQKVDSLFPLFKSQNIIEQTNEYIDYIYDFFQYKMYPNDYVNCDQIIDNISSNLFLIDDFSNLIKLPKMIIFLIISNENARAKNEDYIFDLISNKMEQDDEDDSFDCNQFLEQIRFQFLSPEKFECFMNLIDNDNISGQLWSNIKSYIISNFQQKNKIEHNHLSKRYVYYFEYDGKRENAFKGIINELTLISNGNICTKNVVKLTVSSLYNAPNRSIEAIVDITNEDTYMQFDHRIDQPKGYSFIIYDFCNYKINIKHYSMRSRNAEPRENHMMNWKIEVSNDGQNWKEIDTKSNERSICNYKAQNTFAVKNKLEDHEFYRYVRFYQTGVDSEGEFYGCISALEFFGSIIFN